MNPHPLTPRMAGILERMRRARRAPMHSMTPQQARVFYDAAAEILEPARAALPRVDDFRIPTPQGARLPARLYAPSDGLTGLLLYLHGGGFVVGGLETHNSLCRQLALRSGAGVVAVEYRLAPEHRFPTAVDDAWAALRWLHDEGRVAIGAPGARLAVAGDSAGGTLATVCAVLARDAGLPLALQLLITPGTSAHADTESHRRYARDVLLDAETIAWFFDHYIDEADRDDWRFAPLNVDALEGVAPACIILAECDPLVDEGLAYADRLRMAGVPVDLDLVRGVTHDFIKMGRALPEAPSAQAWAAVALKEALTR